MEYESNGVVYRSALIYAKESNLPVFPTSKKKIPLIKDWYHKSSRDPEVITKWWEEWPDANVSMPTGSASERIILDVDVKNGQCGFDSLRELKIIYGDLPKTPTSITPSGGQQIFFTYDGPPIGRRIRFMPGLDLMAEKSQVLLPPSQRDDGKRYVWEVSARIDEIAFAPVPKWLIEVATRAITSIACVEEFQVLPPSHWGHLIKNGAKEGNRNQAVAQLAGHLFRKYADPFLVLEFVSLWNEHRNRPPLSADEVIKTVESIAAIELRRRSGRAA